MGSVAVVKVNDAWRGCMSAANDTLHVMPPTTTVTLVETIILNVEN